MLLAMKNWCTKQFKTTQKKKDNSRLAMHISMFVVGLLVIRRYGAIFGLPPLPQPTRI
jgi:hypothetical protein